MGKGSLTLASATLAGGAIVYLATPLVTRVFDPSAFGDYGIYLSVVALLTPVATQNYVEAIALPATESDAWSLTRSVLANTIRFSLLAFAIIAVVFAADAVDMVPIRVPLVLWVVPFGVYFAGGQATMLRWLIRRERYSPSVRARIAQGATMAVGQPVLGLATGFRAGMIGALPLAGADAFSTGVGFLILARRSFEGFRLRYLVGLQRERLLLRRYRLFMIAGLPATESTR